MDTKLPDFLLAEIYGDKLISIRDSNTKNPIAYLGDNVKNVVIVVNEKIDGFISDETLALLERILAPCKLQLQDVAIINFYNQKVSYSKIQEELHPARLLMFDVSTEQIALPFKIPNYQVQPFDHCQVLCSAALGTMLDSADNPLKEKEPLWKALKRMFNL